ncbi:dTMP kinase [Pseudoroseomonas wenyumeiae]|uniref:Thymidylate kinase n=1 Tax=Teichococcus wenyumeiae TaxID=2478470 RepID=A0A3A9JG14_9PROT|nr:dTMP kinase [Pseudoroseomonas wenyumeiae]RKK04271.1 dTMP kinase [Pseudoroseomonas wenyumeiae]RMI19198.1 dTMP kinase [Pseudoroseomonas wenyumeiae]
MTTDKARFITLEGGEGAGKTTLARRLTEALAAAGRPVLRTREPGGAPGAEALRALMLHGTVNWDPVAEAMLMFAARREHLAKTIRPALEAGIWVVCDRFADSTLAYQCYGHGLDAAVWRKLADVALDGFAPDATLVLDLPPEAGMARALTRGLPDRFERLGAAFHARVHEGFRAIAVAEPHRCTLLDAAQPPEAVFAAASVALHSRLGLAL